MNFFPVKSVLPSFGRSIATAVTLAFFHYATSNILVHEERGPWCEEVGLFSTSFRTTTFGTVSVIVFTMWYSLASQKGTGMLKN